MTALSKMTCGFVLNSLMKFSFSWTGSHTNLPCPWKWEVFPFNHYILQDSGDRNILKRALWGTSNLHKLQSFCLMVYSRQTIGVGWCPQWTPLPHNTTALLDSVSGWSVAHLMSLHSEWAFPPSWFLCSIHLRRFSTVSVCFPLSTSLRQRKQTWAR